jgi:hypothetical protein
VRQIVAYLVAFNFVDGKSESKMDDIEGLAWIVHGGMQGPIAELAARVQHGLVFRPCQMLYVTIHSRAESGNLLILTDYWIPYTARPAARRNRPFVHCDTVRQPLAGPCFLTALGGTNTGIPHACAAIAGPLNRALYFDAA